MSSSFVTLWTVTHLSMGFPRQEYCSGVAISFCRWSSWLRDRTHVSCIVGRFFTTEPPGKTIHICMCVYTHTHTHTRLALEPILCKYWGATVPRGQGGKSWIFLASCLELVFSLIILWVHVMLPVPSVALASPWSERVPCFWKQPGEKGPLCAMPIRPNLSAQRQSKELSKMLLALRLCYLSGSVIFFLLLQKSAWLVHFKLPLILNGGFSAPWIHPWGGSHWSLCGGPLRPRKPPSLYF